MALASRQWLPGADLGGRFTDVRLLRAGSRFVLLEAHDTSANRTVVIKVPDEASGAWLHDVLNLEGRILAALGGHPNVLSSYQQIRLEDGRPALLLERCVGTLLEGMHREEPMDLQDAVAIGIKLAGALETVHRGG
jgi:eukaryotic-like serine/threonine-protein kinase